MTTIEEMIADLRKVHKIQCERFKKKHGREAEISDQLKKHAEEIGEFIKAIDGKNDEPPLDELWDCVFSMLAVALNEKGLVWTDGEIMDAYHYTMLKIEARAEGIQS